ncbi:hypothetical protein CBE01nite_32170 [Clostridium beijerinckii]|uniref:Uncharacterized protein n=1 Tax=Clostridium diolis TaxID=223919 RepID=A0AAV3W0A7_9CLOT|nr:hypothetical protein CDIOL_17550 [Clostridium diolis]GEP65449.1 hypothetical protein CBE01nite_32170 [Clostridium beijerinckii]
MLLILNKRACYISEKENELSLTTDTVNHTINNGIFFEMIENVYIILLKTLTLEIW